MQDIRWKQRFNNYIKAFQTLREAVILAQTRKLSTLERQGLIQGFEFTHELAWNVLKDYLQHKGYVDLIGSKDATRMAFKNNLIIDGDAWMEMIKARSLSLHTYNIEVAENIEKDILTRFYPAFIAFEETFNTLSKQPD